MATTVQRIFSCKPCLWALFGTFLMLFGAVGLTTCSDGSKQIARIATLEGDYDAIVAERDTLRTNFDAQNDSLTSMRASLLGGSESLAVDVTSPDALGALRDEVVQLAATKQALEAQNSVLKSDLDTLNGLVDDEQLRAAALAEEVGFQATRLEEIKAELEDYQDRDVANDDRFLSMRSSIASLSVKSANADELAVEVEDLSQQIAAATAERDDTAAAAMAEAAFLEEIRTELAATEKALIQRDVELAGLKADGDEASRGPSIDPAMFSSAAERTKLLEADREDTLESLTRSLAAARRTRSNMIQEIDALYGDLDSSRDQIRSLRNEVRSLEDERAELELQTNDLMSERDTLSSQLSAMAEESEAVATASAKIADLSSKLSTAQADYATLKSSVEGDLTDGNAALEEMQTALAGAEATIADLEAQIAEQQETTGNLQQNLARAKSDGDRLKAYLADATEAGEEVAAADASKIDDLNLQIETLEAALEEEKSATASARKRLTAIAVETESELGGLREKLTETEAALSTAAEESEAEADSLRSQMAVSQEERDDLVIQIEELRTELDAVQEEDSSALEGLQSEIAALQQEIEANAASVGSSRSDLMSANTESDTQIDDLQLALVESQESGDRLTVTIEDLRAEIDAMNEEAEAQQQLAATVAGLKASGSAAEAELAALIAAAEASEGEIDALEGKLAAAEAASSASATRIDDMRALLSEQRDRNEELEGQLAAAGEESTAAAARLSELDAEFDDVTAAREAATGEISSLEARIAEMNAELEAAREETTAAEAALAGLQNNVEGLTAERNAANANSADLEADLTAKLIDLEAVQDELKEATSQIAILSGQSEAFEAMIGNIEGERDSAADDAETSARRVSALEQQIADLRSGAQTQMDDLNAEIAAAAKSATELEGQIPPLQERISALEGEIFSQTGRIHEMTTERSEIEAQLADAEERATRFGTQLSEAPTQQQLEAYKTRLADTAQIADDFQFEIIALRSQMAAATATDVEMEAELVDLRERLSAVFEESGNVQDRNDILTRQLEEARAQQSALEAAAAVQPPAVSNATSDALRAGLIQALGSDAVENADGTIALSSNLTFSSGSATLSPVGQAVLSNAAGELVRFLGDRPDVAGKIVVEGHTDADPINTPRYPSNWTLSAARAATVVNFLIQQGVPAGRIAAVAYAETQPIDPAPTREAFARNRRIQFDFAAE